MSDFTSSNTFPIKKPVNAISLKKAVEQIENLQGVDNSCILNNSICVDYYPQLISNEILIDIIENEGLLIDNTTPEDLKGFKKFLKKLEISNKKNFGTQQLDCCNLNQKNKK